MLLTIHNDQLSLTVDTHGAQMMSVKSADGTEYLWQGDPQYWPDRARTRFPFIGRLYNNRYQYKGVEHTMGIHGFAAAAEFIPLVNEGNRLSLAICPSREIEEQYPFDFCFQVSFLLHENEIQITYKVGNMGAEVMPFAVGGHPGFRVPLEEGEDFTDYSLEFSCPCRPDRVGFTPAVYMNGHDDPYELEDGRRISLRHDLFDEDAIILKNMDRQVTLRSRKSGRGVTVTYPQMPYLGIWHWPKTDAPYVCIEPWSSLPGRDGLTEELSCRSDLIHLQPDEIYENKWTISVF